MEETYLTIADFKLSGKSVLVRVDVNSPVDPETLKVIDDSRIREHAETLKRLSEAGAKVVVLAHQGRSGDPDFIPMRQHVEILSRILGRPVKYVNDTFGEEAQKAVKALDNGDILFLENVRFWAGEAKDKPGVEHAESPLVKNLAPLLDIFVNDAFAAAHRSHASMMGFAEVLPSAAGLIMERELKALGKVLEGAERPCVYVLGGAKADDAVDVTNAVLGKGIADTVLTCGVIGQLFLCAKGFDLGVPNSAYLKNKGYDKFIPAATELIREYGLKIKIPVDVAVRKPSGVREEIPVERLPAADPIQDLGLETARQYGDILRAAKTIVVNGPAGVYEEKGFEVGTREILEASIASGGFTVIGGGHTVAAARELNIADKIGYMSTGGGAFIEYLIKGTLPAVEALKKAAKR